MKNFKYFILTVVFICTLFLTTGCSNDSMDNIDIIVTNYPTEYITKKLYEDHATITSIILMELIFLIIRLVINKRKILLRWIYLFIMVYLKKKEILL